MQSRLNEAGLLYGIASRLVAASEHKFLLMHIEYMHVGYGLCFDDKVT